MKRFGGASVYILAAATCVAPAVAQGQPAGPAAGTFAFAIPAGSLASALSTYSNVTGIQVVASPALIGQRQTQGVTGRYTPRAALAVLLRGTRLRPVMTDGVLILRADGAGPRPPAARVAAAPVFALAIGAGERDPLGHDGDIVVTGYRSSLTAAQDLKRRAVGAEDDILASDIAAFPDLNLAESLQRVPGITITRDSGEGRQIALRGLGADFTRTQLNGMEVLGNTASGMDNRGGVSRSRAFDYSLFASELFNRVAVQKSYAAEQDEGGIAGTVQLTTAKPFDYQGPKFVISAKGQTNGNTNGVTPRLVGLASMRQGDFGALISLAYSQIHNNEYGYRNWGWGLTKYAAANIGPDIDDATRGKLLAGVWQPTAQSPSSWYTDRRRLGVTTALQYHPGERFKLDVDLLYGRLWDHRDDYAIASAGANPLTGTTINGGQIIQSAVIDGTNTLRAASYTGIDERSEHHIVENHADFYQAVANGEWTPSDRLTIHALGGYEESDFGQPVFDKVFLEARNMAFSYDTRPADPRNTYGKDLTDPDNWALQRLDVQENRIVSRYTNGKLDVAYALDSALTLKVGGAYKHFSNSGYTWANKVFHNKPTLTAIPNALKQTVGVDTLTQYIVGDVDRTYALIGDTRNLTAANLQAGSDYRVDEKTWAGFAQLDLDTNLGDMRLRANAGVRYYSTDLVSSGNLATASGFQPVSIGTNSKGWLPAVNVALDVTKEVVLRVSASRNVNRPGLGDLAAAGSITTRPNGGSLSLGNPFLRPYKATSIEGSAEWYMDRHGFASIGVFYKNMDSFITSSSKQIPYGETGLPLSLLVQGQDASTPYDVSQPINGPGAKIKGIEAAIQHDFTFLPGTLKNLGFVANGTWFDGHRTAFYTTAGVKSSRVLPLDNLSKWAFNATLYYENPVWGVRVSDAYRSQYLTGAGNALANSGGGIRATNNVDFQAHINIRPGVRLIAEGINVTNEPIRQFASIDAYRTEVYTTSGRIFSLGITASF
ncbi:TonB-dependent receptor [Sphingomonadaceae bacterium jetA1]|jgi:TonB-dependent receptor|uniref:TonB-dependent receptor n=1 Tax=Facivitalis istanbulensis TaxID=3075838 RepID=UPI00346C33F9